jgi:hypothetical protein
MNADTRHNTKLAWPFAVIVRLHRWWVRRRWQRRADKAAQDLQLLIGEDNVAWVRQVCFDIAEETGAFVGPCEIVQAILAAASESEIYLSQCGGGYAEIKRLVQGDLVAGRVDREAWTLAQ